MMMYRFCISLEVQVVYGGYAWTEYVMPKTTRKGKGAPVSSDISEVDCREKE